MINRRADYDILTPSFKYFLTLKFDGMTIASLKTNNLKWDVTNDRFVGFIDIMGFKDLVARNTHERIYKMMLKVAETIEDIKHVYINDDKSGNPEASIHMTTYSDSIMIYSRDGSPDSMENFIQVISSLTEDLFLNEIPHKGAVAYGTMTLDFEKSIFFGQPLIDAYLLQDELSFYGIVVHSSAEYRRGFRSDELVLEYDCPFKAGVGRHYTILPETFLEDNIGVDYSALTRSVRRLRSKTSGALRKYIDNTVAYLDSAVEKTVK